MKFWDSSAITPLLVKEADSPVRAKQFREDPVMLVWYGTPAEIESSLCRKEREGALVGEQAKLARERLARISKAWLEVQPTTMVRVRAIRLLRVHPLRAADAFQLAAALCGFEEDPTSQVFYTGDQRLAQAAAREGFVVR